MMDTRDGRIYTEALVAQMEIVDRAYMRQMAYDPTPTQRARRRVGRNDPCPCGSGKKFKRCCLGKANP